MSCCSRMLGLEHVASRGSISIEYYGRNVGIKIMPTGVKPERFLAGFAWQDTIWRRGELLSQASSAGNLWGLQERLSHLKYTGVIWRRSELLLQARRTRILAGFLPRH